MDIYNISQGVFNIFKDEKGKFKACLFEETKGGGRTLSLEKI